MDFDAIITHELFILYGIPILICLARILDVTLGTLRIMFVAKGMRKLAPILGFFEIIIWLLAITQVMQNLNGITNILAYALGFSLGNYVGMYIENRLAIGMVVVRIITKRDSENLVRKLRFMGHSVTVTDADGNIGPVNVVFSVMKRSEVKDIVPIIKHYNPRAVYSVEDVRHVSDLGLVHEKPKQVKRPFSERQRGVRK